MDNIWKDEAQLLDKLADTLNGCFRSLCDTRTRLDNKKSGDCVPELTEREEWIIPKLVFLKTVLNIWL